MPLLAHPPCLAPPQTMPISLPCSQTRGAVTPTQGRLVAAAGSSGLVDEEGMSPALLHAGRDPNGAGQGAELSNLSTSVRGGEGERGALVRSSYGLAGFEFESAQWVTPHRLRLGELQLLCCEGFNPTRRANGEGCCRRDGPGSLVDYRTFLSRPAFPVRDRGGGGSRARSLEVLPSLGSIGRAVVAGGPGRSRRSQWQLVEGVGRMPSCAAVHRSG